MRVLRPHKVNFLFLVGMTYVITIQHTTTVFTQPALSGFTIQARSDVASNPGFTFRILSRRFGEKSEVSLERFVHDTVAR